MARGGEQGTDPLVQLTRLRFPSFGHLVTASQLIPANSVVNSVPLEMPELYRGTRELSYPACHFPDPALPGRPAAVDEQVLAGHEAAGIAGQKDNRPLQFVGPAHAAH